MRSFEGVLGPKTDRWLVRTAAGLMLATEVLTAHHDELRALLADVGARLEQSPAQSTSQRALAHRMDELADELAMHEMIEDAIFYPAMADTSTLVAVAHPEHRQISDQLATVLRTPVGPGRFADEFAALRTALEQHMELEEERMFREVERKVDRAGLEEIGDRLTSKLQRLRASRLTRLRLRLKRRMLRHAPVIG